jgi:Winged helix DNA-binding domain
VQGRWRLDRTRTAATLVVEPFGPLPGRARSALAEEGAELLQLLAADCSTHDVRFDAST